MTPVMKKARKGNRDAMTALYQSNKKRVFCICNLLLCDAKAAEQACISTFKSAWDHLLGGNLETEEEFADFVIRKAATHCKGKLSKANGKAFRIPANKNFSATPYTADSVVTEGDICIRILGSLPALHRFIYVLSAYARWSDEEIAELIHAKPDVVKAALDAEKGNLDRLLLAIKQKTKEETSLRAENFHALMTDGEQNCQIPDVVSAVVLLTVDSIADPLEKKAKLCVRKTVSGVIAACLVCALLALGIVKLVSMSVNSNVDNGGTDSENTEDTDNTGSISDDDDIYAEIEAIEWVTEIENPTHYAVIEIADYGTVTVALDGNSAPETVENFVTLANEGFYDGLTFHRIIEGFMMQGGDPKGNETGGNTDEDGSEITITGEFWFNDIDNYLSHVRGAISMARGDSYNSASSQFFIVHEDRTESLDLFYAAFGYVIDGMEVVDAICEAAEPTDDNGTIEAADQPVITRITAYTAEEYEALTDGNETDEVQ